MKSTLKAIPLIAVVLAACVTINVYFPEAKIKDLSEQIEEEIRKQAEDSEPSQEVPESSGGQSGLLDLVLGVTPASAQEVPSPGVSNPAIRRVIDSRAKRLSDLTRYFDAGVIGENNEGLVEIVALDLVEDLRERAEVQRIVKAENADRQQLYEEIAAAENVDPSQLPRIRETYAQTLREKAKPGWWIQTPDGSWTRK